MNERLLDLLARRATEGIDEAESAEAERLLAAEPEAEADFFDLPAAATHLAAGFRDDPLPEELKRRVLAQAAEYFAGSGGETVTAPPPPPPPRPAARFRATGWYAAAAALLFAVLGWWSAYRTWQDLQVLPVAPVAVRGAEAALAAARRAEVEAGGEALVLPWTATEDPAARGVTGEVVWNQRLQAGFMRFRGLPANDPGQAQYQLWIFDQNQDERYPVDGGVFDIPAASGEVVVPIDAKLRIDRPTLFAVTVEQPGGVVVSSRERLVLVASPS